MRIKEWGNAIWYLFHTLAYKLHSEESAHADELFKIFLQICNNLPCPKCREHAVKIMSKQKRVKGKKELEIFMWKFHNDVNISLKRKEMSYADYEAMYIKANTWQIVRYFVQTMKKNTRVPRMMLDSYHRNKCVASFIKYINKNRHRFKD